MFTVSQVANKLRLPIDDVRKAIRETGIGKSVHADGHWQRRIREEEMQVVLAHVNDRRA